MSKVTISQLTTHRSHTHTALSSHENQYLVWSPHASMHMYIVPTGDSFRKGGIDFPGQDPDFDKQHADKKITFRAIQSKLHSWEGSCQNRM